MEDRKYTSTCEISVADDVATITLLPMDLWLEKAGVTPAMTAELDAWYDLHSDLARAIVEVRERRDVRVIVITGARDGTFAANPTDPDEAPFYAGPRDAEGKPMRRTFTPNHYLRTFTGVNKQHEAIASCEKPIIAKVNGNAFGNGLGIMLSCDMIAARDDALMVEYHMGLDEWPSDLAPDISRYVAACRMRGIVPGDGGLAWVPLYMTPARAKEFLMLGRPYTAKDFEQMGIINYAVPAERLGPLVDDLVQRLLSRPQPALVMTKRIANRSVMQHLNLTLDAGSYAEWLSIALGGRPELG